MKKLYITDLDGTLLHSDATLSEYEIAKIKEFCEKGILFSVATARSMITGGQVLKGVTLSAPAILMNGVFVYNFEENKVIKYCEIQNEPYRRVLKIFEKHSLHPNVFSFDGEQLSIQCTGIDTPAMQWFFDTRKVMLDGRFYIVNSLEKLPHNQSPVYFNLYAPRDLLLPVAEELENLSGINFAFYPDQYTNGWLLEVFADTASKANALNFLKEYMNADETVAFGDNLNDIPMLSVADRSVAVSNAVPQVKEIADIIIGENNDDSVVKFIAKENGIKI